MILKEFFDNILDLEENECQILDIIIIHIGH